MKFSEYPGVIAGFEREVLRLSQQLRKVQETVNALVNEAERSIAFDADLKNEAQRKAKRLELLGLDERYLSATQMVVQLSDRKAEVEIDLAFYRARFSVLKLEVRDRIAQAELRSVA